MWCGRYEPHVMAALRRILRPGDTFVDLGAHIGYHSYFAAGPAGASGRVFSFEADPANFLRLRKNLEYFPQASPEHCAIWSGEEDLMFSRSESLKESGRGLWRACAMRRSASTLLSRLSDSPLQPGEAVGKEENVDCIAVPEERKEFKEMKYWRRD